MLLKIATGVFIEHKVLLGTSQHPQIVFSTLAVATAEVGEQVVADDGAKPIFSLMSGSRILGVDILGCLQPHLKDLLLFSVKGLFILD
jgi:hypothetical protein